MISSLKELMFGLDPLIADPTLKKFKVKIEDLNKTNRIVKGGIKGIFFNSSFFKGLPAIKDKNNKIYIFSVNFHSSQISFIRVLEEMKNRNLRPINISLFLYLNLKSSILRKEFKNIGYMDSKIKMNFYLASFNEEKIDFSVYKRDAILDREIYFLCEKIPSFFERLVSFIKTSVPNILFYSR
ncbi:MAG: hypothetical protein WCO35_00995 [Candidatus Nomurabacteria bacterium]